MKCSFITLTIIPFGWVVLGSTCPGQQPTWTQIRPATSPSARHSHAMAYDLARQRTVLFGGTAYFGGLHQADTWEWELRGSGKLDSMDACAKPAQKPAHVMLVGVALVARSP